MDDGRWTMTFAPTPYIGDGPGANVILRVNRPLFAPNTFLEDEAVATVLCLNRPIFVTRLAPIRHPISYS